MISAFMLGDDAQHLFQAGDLLRWRFGQTVAFFNIVKIWGEIGRHVLNLK